MIAFNYRLFFSACLLCIATVCSTAIAQQEPAIRFSNIVGTVLVNQGETFKDARANMSLRAGFRLITLSHSHTTIVRKLKDEECEQQLPANTHALITNNTPCEQWLVRYHVDDIDSHIENSPEPSPSLDERLLASPVVQCSGETCIKALGLEDASLPLLSPE